MQHQEKEKFQNTIEGTLQNLITSRTIKGLVAEMPPEFDDYKMLERSKVYLRNRSNCLILLPGNSIENKEWIESCSSSFRELFPQRYAHYYKHWSEKGKIIDISYEVDALTSTIDKNEPIVLFAKSAGIIVALKAMAANLIQPSACIFVGLPVLWVRDLGIDIKPLIDVLSVKTLLIQNKEDPFGSEQQVREFMTNRHIKLEILQGKSHNYDDFDLLEQKIIAFL